jgi:hypothetical protein
MWCQDARAITPHLLHPPLFFGALAHPRADTTRVIMCCSPHPLGVWRAIIGKPKSNETPRSLLSCSAFGGTKSSPSFPPHIVSLRISPHLPCRRRPIQRAVAVTYFSRKKSIWPREFSWEFTLQPTPLIWSKFHSQTPKTVRNRTLYPVFSCHINCFYMYANSAP